MKLTFLTGMPYTFYAESTAGEMRYSIGLYERDRQEDVVEVTPETWDRLLRAQQVEHLNTLAVAVDGDHSVGGGRVGTIAQRINDIADQNSGETVFDSSEKSEPEVEPS